VVAEGGRERVGGVVADGVGGGGQGEFAGAPVVAGEGHSPVADTIAALTGRPVRHQDIDPEVRIGGAVAAGLVPADYTAMLRRPPSTTSPGATAAVADLHRDYGEVMRLHSAEGLAVHRDPGTSVVVLEYAVHGRAVRTGRPYDNHFVSVITVKNREVTHWRDYMDPVAVFRAIGWPARDQ